MSRFILKTLQSTSSEINRKIADFRAHTSDINGNIRSSEEEIHHQEKYCSDSDIKTWILVFEDENIVGMAAIFGRNIKHNNTKVRLGGIGKVRVRQDKRNLGIANMMMKEAMRQLQQLKFDVAFLSTDLTSFLRGYYERYGFMVLNKDYTFIGKSGKKYVENDGMLASINSDVIFKQIISDNKAFHIGTGNW